MCHPRLPFAPSSLSLFDLCPLFRSLCCAIDRTARDVLTALPTCDNYSSTMVLPKCHARDFTYQVLTLFSMQHWKAGNRAWVRGVNNWFITASSLGLVAGRQIMLVTPHKDQSIHEALLCRLVLELCSKTVPSTSYKTRDKVWPIVGILCYNCFFAAIQRFLIEIKQISGFNMPINNPRLYTLYRWRYFLKNIHLSHLSQVD